MCGSIVPTFYTLKEIFKKLLSLNPLPKVRKQELCPLRHGLLGKVVWSCVAKIEIIRGFEFRSGPSTSSDGVRVGCSVI